MPESSLEQLTLEETTPPRVLEADAQRIWARAVELQLDDEKRQSPAPAEPLAATDVAAAGFALTRVREAAIEAGVSTAFIDLAIEEHQLSVQSVDATTRPTSANARLATLLAGASLQPSVQFTLRTELDDEQITRLADAIGEAWGTNMCVTTAGRRVTLESAEYRAAGAHAANGLYVRVVRDGGQTRLTATEELGRVARSTFGLAVGGFGGVVGYAITLEVLQQTQHGWLGLATFAGIVAASYFGARLTFARHARKRVAQLEQQLRSIAASISTRVQTRRED